jgi:hypothetical protein
MATSLVKKRLNATRRLGHIAEYRGKQNSCPGLLAVMLKAGQLSRPLMVT